MPYPTFYKGEDDKRMGELMVAGYPAYMLNETNNKSETNYFPYAMAGTSRLITKTERGGTVVSYDDIMATTGQEGGPLLARHSYCFDWECIGIHNGFHLEGGVYTATIITQ